MVKKPNNNKTKIGKPANVNAVSDGIRVKHTEYITGVSRINAGFIVDGVTDATKVIRLALNPGDGDTFPWLSQIAPNFEHYIINSMTVTYEPTISQYYVGAVVLSPELDPTDSSSQDIKTLATYLNKRYAVKTQVSKRISSTMNLAKFGSKYVRASHKATHTQSALRHYDVGHIDVLLYNIDSSDPADYGEIKVTYDVTLLNPNLSFNSSKSHHIAGTSISSGGAASYGCPLGDINGSGTGIVEYVGAGTAGLRHEFTNSFTMVGTATETNRLHFDEPFNGVLAVFTDAIAGLAAVPGLVSSLTWGSTSTATGKLAKWEKIKSIGTLANGLASMYKVVANAGDVMDLVWDTAGQYVVSNAQVLLTDAAANVVPLLAAI
jgi:hypothetical protein